MNNSILFNIAGLAIQNNLSYANSQMSCTLERMSSGLKVNHAKDNAADYVISRKMNVQLSGMKIANENTQQAIGMLNVADSALVNMTEKTNKIRDLALKAMDSSCSFEERVALQNQVEELWAEIKREKETTVYNKTKVFDVNRYEKIQNKPYAYEVEYIEATGGQKIDTGYVCNMDDNYSYTMKGDFRGNSGWVGANAFLQINFKDNTATTGAGASANLSGKDTITCTFKDKKESLNVNGEDISTRNWSTYGGKNVKIGIFALGSNGGSWHGTSSIKGKLSSYQLYKDDELVLDLRPVVDNNDIACMYDTVSGQLYYNSGSGKFKAGPEKEPEYIEEPYELNLQVGSNAGVDNSIAIELGFKLTNYNSDILTATNAKKTLQTMDELNDLLQSKRSKIGSTMNRLDSIMELQNNNKVNLSSTKSSLVDADIAQEASNHARNQILQQISTSLFTQANSMNGSLAQRLLMGI